MKYVAVIFFFFFLSWLQIYLLPRDQPAGDFFLYGRDTLAHDAIIQIYFQNRWESFPGIIPLWMTDLHAGSPTLGTLLFTPFHFSHWLFSGLSFPTAQKLSLAFALVLAAVGGFLWAKANGLRLTACIVCGVVCGFSGHLVTLIHAGHFLKIMALAGVPLLLASCEYLLRRDRCWLSVAGFGGALGLMVNAGHPQIAYLALMIVGLRVIFHRSAWSLDRLGRLLFGGIIGVLLAAPTILSVLEFAPHSNRAGGVSFEEATATSYPPAELLEFLIFRHQGSSVAGDVYTGSWGERIVSDYLGIGVFLLIGIGFCFKENRGSKVLWIVIAGFFLLIGLGRFFPLYGFLYSFFPGFSSFRSPGTFMAGSTFSFGILAAYGLEDLARIIGRFPRFYRQFPAILILPVILISGTLLSSNRHFLIAHSWEDYQVQFLAENELDFWIAQRSLQDAVHDEQSPLGLRPILFGRQARNGYHPVYFKEKQITDETLGFQSEAWYARHAVTHVLLPSGIDLPTGLESEQVELPGRTVLRISRAATPLLEKRPSGFVVQEEGGAVGLLIQGQWLVDGEARNYPSPVWVDGSTGREFVYTPTSYRLGLILFGCGLAVVGGLVTASISPRRVRSQS